MNHRNGDIGNYMFVKLNERSAKMICDNPYPCSFDKGILQSVGRKFAPKDAIVHVDHDQGECRTMAEKSAHIP